MAKEVLSEIEVTLNVIGGKWKPLILHLLQTQGTKRYSEILRYLETAPKKTVTAQLRELEDDQIIKREVIPTAPVQVNYSVTELGKSLFPLLDVMCSWGYVNMNDQYQLKHPTCEPDEATMLDKQDKLNRLGQLFTG
ncbi:phage integrase family site-specific recombinase [Lentilactobacillus senioris DSM 24302 = JCM 17472]|uniref:Phage integrase family site-specific recombinase n=1 Tax=Lentilactobacillus senioris DSM 24302 = JCM 17472 TaxID=1423802 RepID=A0A0R2CQX1_9LACO|nr:helix-turn-helix domain-containing protein [Lentilactobacillus senioris]KRM94257.1 phage integrase family site-specific recombinase [Lentilactobacillus senioris DSM 24302 = JCM 17472]